MATDKHGTVDAVDVAADGGQGLSPGMFAIDAESDDESAVLVVRVPDVTAGEYVVPGTGKTVADYNECRKNEPVLEVTFVEAMNKRWDAWTAKEVLDVVEDGRIHETGVRTYAYPRSRLRPVRGNRR